MNHHHTQSNHKSHLWLMLACCLIPIGLIFAVAVFGISLDPLAIFLPYAMVLFCPLLMFFMMRGMQHGEGEAHHAEPLSAAPGRPLPDHDTRRRA